MSLHLRKIKSPQNIDDSNRSLMNIYNDADVDSLQNVDQSILKSINDKSYEKSAKKLRTWNFKESKTMSNYLTKI